MDAPRSRGAAWSRHRRTLANLRTLYKTGLITQWSLAKLERRARLQYEAWMRALGEDVTEKCRGRRKDPSLSHNIIVCKKEGCSLPTKPGYAYCSRDHAPLGDLWNQLRREA